MTSNKTVADLLAAEIQDLYSFEKQLTKPIPQMAKGSKDSTLQAPFTADVNGIGVQMTRLEQAAEMLGITAGGNMSPGIEGCSKDGAQAFEPKGEDHVFDLDLIGFGNRVAHYKKITGYTTAITLAQSIGAKDVVSLLKHSLAAEVAASEELLFIAASLLNNAAAGARAKAFAV